MVDSQQGAEGCAHSAHGHGRVTTFASSGFRAAAKRWYTVDAAQVGILRPSMGGAQSHGAPYFVCQVFQV